MYVHDNNYGLDPNDFETHNEFLNAIDEKRIEKFQNIRTDKSVLNDKIIYNYCGVMLPFSSRPYSFRTDDNSIKIGDEVVVPIGKEEKEFIGIVVSIGQYSKLGVPYPIEKTKYILRKADDETKDKIIK